MPVNTTTSVIHLNCRGQELVLYPGVPEKTVLMGILNVTPDSFWDGGRYLSAEHALDRAAELVAGGALIIDVGGESSRPRGRHYGEGAQPVSAEEECRRVLPVIEALAHRYPDTLISIDTYKPEVARKALDAGAHIVNDITGLRHAPELAHVVAEAGAALVLMHSVGKPGAMLHEQSHRDVMTEVMRDLTWSIEQAHRAGVKHLILDPGFGFGKTPEENLCLLNQIPQLMALGYPVLVGISRKSTIGVVLGSDEAPRPPAERLFGTLGATAIAVLRGATLVRTHDVRPTADMLTLMGATLNACKF